ncbi:transferase [Ampelomyces quisqualis]|uniref:Transferase n=1 Tax=Ampelomyces quisqualis TaxID=50730 RepID=A0A6A5QXW2_AMPQU|nr:transferase [Ampelomyces quisqualis]
MPTVEEFQLRPLGWENDPEQERFKLSTLDYLSTITYTNSALFFRLGENEKIEAAAILQAGLERTLSQIRHLAGTIEKDEDGQYSIIRTKHTFVRFVVQHLDTREDDYPSFDKIAKAHFLSPILGDIEVLSNSGMTCGNIPEAHPDNSPAISSYKANFIPGGLIFNVHSHHWSNGLAGATYFFKQLAENCYALKKSTKFPSFDPRCLNRSLFGVPGFDRPSLPTQPQIDAPPRAHRNSEHKPSQSLIFHLPKSKATLLKAAASPSNGSRISTYNAVCALMWRVLCRIRQPLYKHSLSSKPLWAQGVTLSKLFTDPPIPERIQGNLQFDITSEMSGIPPLTLGEIISSAPLHRLATYTREMTDCVTMDMLTAALAKFANVRNKADLSIHVDALPPMSVLLTDWRMAKYCTFDFGFGIPECHRHLFGGVPLCLAVVYAPHRGPAGEDEGLEVQLSVETELVETLLEDEEWVRYFEFRGVDAWDEESEKLMKGKKGYKAKL